MKVSSSVLCGVIDAVIPLIADFSRYSAACVSSTRADLRQIMKG